jgi:hypothetical protein
LFDALPVPTLPVDFAALRIAAFPELCVSTERCGWDPVRDLWLGNLDEGMVAAWTATSSRTNLECDAEILAEAEKLISDGPVSGIDDD